jgi:hypothetical protein
MSAESKFSVALFLDRPCFLLTSTWTGHGTTPKVDEVVEAATDFQMKRSSGKQTSKPGRAGMTERMRCSSSSVSPDVLSSTDLIFYSLPSSIHTIIPIHYKPLTPAPRATAHSPITAVP